MAYDPYSKSLSQVDNPAMCDPLLLQRALLTLALSKSTHHSRRDLLNGVAASTTKCKRADSEHWVGFFSAGHAGFLV